MCMVFLFTLWLWKHHRNILMCFFFSASAAVFPMQTQLCADIVRVIMHAASATCQVMPFSYGFE